MAGEVHTYMSIDSEIYDENNPGKMGYTTEYLNSMELANFPLHKL
jgi:hypothetical protein